MEAKERNSHIFQAPLLNRNVPITASVSYKLSLNRIFLASLCRPTFQVYARYTCKLWVLFQMKTKFLITLTSSLSLFSLSLFSTPLSLLPPSSCHWSSKLYCADVCYQSRVCWYHCWYVCQPLASSLPLPSLPLIPASSSPTSCSSSHHHLPTSLSLSLPVTPLISTPLLPPDSCDDTSVCLSVDPCTCHSLGWCLSSPHLPPGEHTCDLLEYTRVYWLDFVWFTRVD